MGGDVRDTQPAAPHNATTRRVDRRSHILLAAGVGVGVLLGVGTLDLGRGGGALPDTAVARVNDRLINIDRFADAIASLARDRGSATGDGDHARVLDRLIDEELLVQHGVEAGLIDSNPSVREAIRAATVQLIVAESKAPEPSEDALRAFYEEHYGQHGLVFFTRIREEILAAYWRRAADEALRGTLDWLWDEAEISVETGARR